MPVTYNNLKAASSSTPTYDSGSFPTTGAYDGQLIVASDTQELFVWDAGSSSWVPAVTAGGGGGGGTYAVDLVTLDATDISNKYVLLTVAPTTKPDTIVRVVGGIVQDYNIDYLVTADDSGRRLSWDGKGLESLLEIGDKLIISYN